jgi:GINS complex subunit 4
MEIDDILAEFDASAPPTAQQDVKELTRYWIAERSAPEILPFQEPLLERLMERIRQQVHIQLLFLHPTPADRCGK